MAGNIFDAVWALIELDALTAQLDVPNSEPVTPLDAEMFPITDNKLPSNVKLVSPFIVPPPVAVTTLLSTLFVIAGNMFDAVRAFIAQLEVPNSDPVIPLVTFNDPVIFVEPVTVRLPVGITTLPYRV